jgi:P4 family phage/plasmid primase-like protien
MTSASAPTSIPTANRNARTAAQHREPEPTRPNVKKGATPEKYADIIIDRNGPFKCSGDDWWRWSGSMWEETNSKYYRRHALAVQSNSRSMKVTNEILSIINAKSQIDSDAHWRYGIGFKNADTVMINVRNGVLRVRLDTGSIEFMEPDPRHHVISQLPVEYDANAKCPTFTGVCQEMWSEEADRTLLQSYAGYSLLPDHRFQCMLFCYGPTNAGKSLIILSGLGSVFGEELMSTVSMHKLCEGGDELRRLQKSLINVCSEINYRQFKDSAIFNQLVCGESMDVAFKYQITQRVKPISKLMAIGNHMPKWEYGSDAQARRMRFLYFDKTFAEKRKDSWLERQLAMEAPGILNWMLEGLLKLVKLDRMPLGSLRSQRMSDRFKTNNNPMGQFLQSEYIEWGDDNYVFSNDFANAYAKWCDYESILLKNTDVGMIIKRLRDEKPMLETPGLKRNGTRVGRAIAGFRLTEKGMALVAGRI